MTLVLTVAMRHGMNGVMISEKLALVLTDESWKHRAECSIKDTVGSPWLNLLPWSSHRMCFGMDIGTCVHEDRFVTWCKLVGSSRSSRSFTSRKNTSTEVDIGLLEFQGLDRN
jgi:hypothetical protein